MFSKNTKWHIAREVQRILKETGESELPKGEIIFQLHVEGEKDWSWADIVNNEAVKK